MAQSWQWLGGCHRATKLGLVASRTLRGTLSLWAQVTFSKGKSHASVCCGLSSWCVCETGWEKVLFISLIESKRPGPAQGWTTGHGEQSFLHTLKGSGRRKAKQTRRRAQTCPQPHQSSLKTQTVISTLQTSTQDLSDFCRGLGAPFLARGTQQSAYSCYSVKPPVAPLVPKSLSQLWSMTAG